MEKKSARASAKATAKPKAGLRKMTVRDLEPKKATDVKGMTYSVIGRCR